MAIRTLLVTLLIVDETKRIKALNGRKVSAMNAFT